MGIILCSVVNIFLRSSGLSFVISIVGVFIFLGLTAWDNQKLKTMATVTGPMQENVAVIRGIFDGTDESEAGCARKDIVVINASAALVAAGVADDFRDGAARAERAIATGAAAAKLEELRKFGRD